MKQFVRDLMLVCVALNVFIFGTAAMLNSVPLMALSVASACLCLWRVTAHEKILRAGQCGAKSEINDHYNVCVQTKSHVGLHITADGKRFARRKTEDD